MGDVRNAVDQTWEDAIASNPGIQRARAEGGSTAGTTGDVLVIATAQIWALREMVGRLADEIDELRAAR